MCRLRRVPYSGRQYAQHMVHRVFARQLCCNLYFPAEFPTSANPAKVMIPRSMMYIIQRVAMQTMGERQHLNYFMMKFKNSLRG